LDVERTETAVRESRDPSDRVGNRYVQATVVRTVLVLRIVASDAQTTATEAELANKIFGASGDALNLKSLFNQCSNGQLQFEPKQTTISSELTAFTLSTFQLPLLRMLLTNLSETLRSPRHHKISVA
jgi:hypothetical protein